MEGGIIDYRERLAAVHADAGTRGIQGAAMRALRDPQLGGLLLPGLQPVPLEQVSIEVRPDRYT
ncbi:MAG TPA: hypothetical protein ENN68_06460 [Methanomicrobia archaeon]|nr:hypothetical protein [Methanomicrobia archaeon]